MRYRLEIFHKPFGYTWCLMSPAGLHIAVGCRGYQRRVDAVRAAQRVVTLIRACVIVGVDE